MFKSMKCPLQISQMILFEQIFENQMVLGKILLLSRDFFYNVNFIFNSLCCISSDLHNSQTRAQKAAFI
jgi:hypothetical protein